MYLFNSVHLSHQSVTGAFWALLKSFESPRYGPERFTYGPLVFKKSSSTQRFTWSNRLRRCSGSEVWMAFTPQLVGSQSNLVCTCHRVDSHKYMSRYGPLVFKKSPKTQWFTWGNRLAICNAVWIANQRFVHNANLVRIYQQLLS